MSHISSKETAVQVKCDLTCNQISETHFYLDFFFIIFLIVHNIFIQPANEFRMSLLIKNTVVLMSIRSMAIF